MSDLARTTRLVRAALANLERHRRRINALNVYPVPDGDTGTNLTATMQGLLRALGDVGTDPTAHPFEPDVALTMMKAAKGNSGVILSTIAQGMAPVLSEVDGDFDGRMLSAALRAGATNAYEEVSPPIEGTMLTVIREMAEEAERQDVLGLSAVDALARVVTRGDQAVARTPEMLDKLREAGVVDAGGVGLVELARGVLHDLNGEPLPDVPEVVEELTDASVHQQESLYRFCTSFVVEGEDVDLTVLRSELEPLGDSLLVGGARSVAKVHIHTDEPERVLALGRKMGVVDSAFVEVGDMHDQAHAREQWLAQLQEAAAAPARRTALVAVAQGRGNREIFESDRASLVVEGGPTLNPSVGLLLEAVAAVRSDHVILLPNDSNIRLAAERAARESAKDVRVMPTRSITEGIAAIVHFDPDLDVDTNAHAIASALGRVVSAEITRASRSAVVDGVEVGEGDFLGLLDGEAFATGEDVWAVLDALLERFAGDGHSFVQVLRGDGAPGAAEIAGRYAGRLDGLEIDIQWGGQPHYPMLLSAE